jgi:hypothetical protein
MTWWNQWFNHVIKDQLSYQVSTSTVVLERIIIEPCYLSFSWGAKNVGVRFMKNQYGTMANLFITVTVLISQPVLASYRVALARSHDKDERRKSCSELRLRLPAPRCHGRDHAIQI